MISELEDDQILEFLMTSDLIENYRPEDFKYLIFKFRSFYKILYGSFQLYKTNNEINVNNFNTDAENFKKQITSLQIEKANLENEIHQLKNTRKLTLKERLSGKTEIKNQ
jgi:hypothetical protein